MDGWLDYSWFGGQLIGWLDEKLNENSRIIKKIYTFRFSSLVQVRKELEVCGIEFYPQKEFDEDQEDKAENDKIRV